MQLKITILSIIIFSFGSGFSPEHSAINSRTLQGGISFTVEPGRTILVKGDLIIESQATIDIKGTLIVEGAMIVSNSLNLTIAGNGKLEVRGGMINKSGAVKNIKVLDNGLFSIDGALETNENVGIVTQGAGLIQANKIIVGNRVNISGTRNIIVSDCSCDPDESEPNFCQLVMAKINDEAPF